VVAVCGGRGMKGEPEGVPTPSAIERRDSWELARDSWVG
jgi:hypothetical protein